MTKTERFCSACDVVVVAVVVVVIVAVVVTCDVNAETDVRRRHQEPRHHAFGAGNTPPFRRRFSAFVTNSQRGAGEGGSEGKVKDEEEEGEGEEKEGKRKRKKRRMRWSG